MGKIEVLPALPSEEKHIEALDRFPPLVLKLFFGRTQFTEISPGHYRSRERNEDYSHAIHEAVFKDDMVTLFRAREDNFITRRGTGWQHVGAGIEIGNYTIVMLRFDEVERILRYKIKANKIAASLKRLLLTSGEN
jgi:hypothetical protein